MRGKDILVTGGTGMIGRELVRLLREDNNVWTASLDSNAIKDITHYQVDLTDSKICQDLCEASDVVFHLAGIKGSPDAAKNRPASFFVPMLQFNTNMMQAALNAKCEHYLYTSSVGVYSPAEVFREDDTENTQPSKNDWFAGWAKRIGEMQAKAYDIQYGWKDYSIIRPANVYGSNDNFDIKNAMVIPSLITKMIENPNEDLVLQGDGSNIRDFVHARDVARAMLFMVDNKLTGPLNIGSGTGVSIRTLVELVAKVTNYAGRITWDGGASGDKKRVMDISRLSTYGFKLSVDLETGLSETARWYRENRESIHNRYNYFEAAK